MSLLCCCLQQTVLTELEVEPCGQQMGDNSAACPCDHIRISHKIMTIRVCLLPDVKWSYIMYIFTIHHVTQEVLTDCQAHIISNISD